MRRLVVAAAALLGVVSSAQALDVNVGVQGGYGWSESEVSIPLYPSEFDLESEGWLLGGFAGVDWDVAPGWSLGVEADANWTDADGSSPSGLVGERYVIEQNWNAALRGRVSFDVASNMEIYGTAGAAWADVDTSYDPLAGGTDSATLQGWTAGLGVERQYAGWFGRVEYRFTDYDDEDFFHNGPSTADLATHAVIIGVGWTM